MNTHDTREVIPAGTQSPFASRHLIPIARFLIERGHKPISCWEKYGFCPSPSGMMCHLTRTITEDDWTAINERFVIPRNVAFYQGLIRDSANGVDIIGFDEVVSLDGPFPAEEWEARQDWSALQL